MSMVLIIYFIGGFGALYLGWMDTVKEAKHKYGDMWVQGISDFQSFYLMLAFCFSWVSVLVIGGTLLLDTNYGILKDTFTKKRIWKLIAKLTFTKEI